MSSQRRHPTLRLRSHGDVTVVRVAADDLSEVNAQAVGDELFQLAAQKAGGRLELDLADVHFLTSTALGKFIALHKRVSAGGGRLALTNVVGRVWEVFAVTRLDQFLDVRRAPAEDGPTLPRATPLAS
jgi:anti-anti-sigma factor